MMCCQGGRCFRDVARSCVLVFCTRRAQYGVESSAMAQKWGSIRPSYRNDNQCWYRVFIRNHEDFQRMLSRRRLLDVAQMTGR